jgi:alkylated DNA repair dioxygenase AlkB
MVLLLPITVEPSDIPAISGLSYHQGWITETEHSLLVAAIDEQPWDCSWERRRQLYGGSYGRDEGSAQPIPSWGLALAARLLAEGLTDRPFDHMLINEYFPGQGIALHRDYQAFDRTVVSLSLLAACVMDFRHPKRGLRESLILEPRSLLVLSDAARYEWQHGIARRKNDRWHRIVIPRARRISITFRSRKQGP